MHPQYTPAALPFDMPRFWAKVDFNGPLPEHHPQLGPCWLWTAGTNEDGYGIVFFNGRPRKAHRLSYELTYGPIPDGLLVCHECDRRICIRPSHFRLGKDRDNNHDMIRKGRAVHVAHSFGDDHWTNQHPGASPIIGTKGEANPGAKLTEDAVRDIRRRYAAGDVSQMALAKEYGVSQYVILVCVQRRTWKHVEDPDAPPAQPRLIVSPRGEERIWAKLTEDDVRAIRARYAAGGISMSALGREYGISAPNVCLIVKRKTWAHVL
jgi:hypothetical protein